jgi:photosystem II stability/assembly factor-like uncharacterized protein
MSGILGRITQMLKSLIRPRSLFISALLIGLIVSASLFFDTKDICAHTPHDPIDALELSPNYAQDKTVFIVISDHLLKSTDGGFSWKELVRGLDNKHLLSSIAVSPSYHTDEILFVSSKGDGIYKSQDAGKSFIKVNNGLQNLNISQLAIYPGYHVYKVALAAGAEGGLYKTADGGGSWYQVMDASARISALAFSSDLRKDIVLAGDHRGILYISVDHGETWTQTYRIPNAGALTSIAIAPNYSSSHSFLVGTEKGGVFQTVDGGISFTKANEGLGFTIQDKYGTFRKSQDGPIIRRDEKNIISLATSPNFESDSTAFASMWNEAVFRSEDGGQTWKRHPLGLTCDYQADSTKYKSSHFRDLRLSSDFEHDRTIFLGGFDGLFKSTDGGRHWTQMETLPLRLIKGLALSSGNKNNLSVALTTYGGGAYTTDDQGSTWAINNRGLRTTRLSDILFSPIYEEDKVLFSASRGYLLKSTDKGETWDKIELNPNESGVPSWRIRINSILNRLGVPSYLSKQVLNEAEGQKPFPTVLAISPNFAADNTLFFGTRYHGIFKSEDGGLNDSVVWDAMGQTITALVISPNFSSDRTLFISIRSEGVFKTVDGGDTWQPTNNGLVFVEDWKSPTVHQITEKDVLLAISPHYRIDRTVFAASSEGLFKTINGGANWKESSHSTLGENSYIIGMTISPNYENDKTLLVSIRGKGLFKTENGGATFAETGFDLTDNNHAIEYIAFSTSYATDDTIYAASDEELFKSVDGGNNWALINRPVRYENMREVVRYEGDWQILKADDLSASSVSFSDIAHDKAILDFVGTGISWLGTKASDQGIARVYLDGKYMSDVDQFSASRMPTAPSFSITGLTYGPHTIEIEVSGAKNSQSTGCRIEVDAFDIAP